MRQLIKVLVFGGSSSKHSINQQLAVYAAQNILGAELDILNLNNYEMPLFSVDKEATLGPQEKAKVFLQKISDCDAIVISLAEHNGSYSAAFKNLLDWTSRIDNKMFKNKRMILMATSPGARGGASVLEAAKSRFPFMGANIIGTFSLPEFQKNFITGQGIVNPEHKQRLMQLLQLIK